MKKEPIILIGPPCCGKTTQGLLLSDKLGRESISIDTLAPQFYDKYGFTKIEFTKIEKEAGYIEAYRAWERSRFLATRDILSRISSNTVVDFGAGHSHYLDNGYNSLISELLRNHTNIVLLLPTKDKGISLKILRDRNLKLRGKCWIKDNFDLLYHWIYDNQNILLATATVFTNNRSNEEVTQDILKILCDD